uniref:Membrane insertase YidC/Oxa/ALB C-terminal domain-containing protein n=2 Tax=Clastoptera arizonana TaxID=38151 RepID=A0A1B6CT92_9HEMI
MFCLKRISSAKIKQIDMLRLRRLSYLFGYNNSIKVSFNVPKVVNLSIHHFKWTRSKHFTNHNCLFELQARTISFEPVFQFQQNVFQKLSESTIVDYSKHLLILIHDSTGLPWFASIILTTFIFRSLVTLPLALYQAYILAKLVNLSPEMKNILKELKFETKVAIHKFNLTELQTKRLFKISAKKQWTKLIERDNCHPAKASLLIWLQIPMWIVISVSLRNLVYMLPGNDPVAQIRYLELSKEGCLWFPDLTTPDSIFLPIALGIINLAIIEIQSLIRLKEKSKLEKIITNVFRGFSILMIPIAAAVPSSLSLYWLSSSVYGLGQNLFLMSPKVKKMVGIPKTSTSIDKPYSHLMIQIKNKFSSH